jgi:hypothetical protein
VLAGGCELVISKDSQSVTLAARLLDCLTRPREREVSERADIGVRPCATVGDAGSFGRVVGDVLREAAGSGPRVPQVEAMLAR